MSDRESPAGSPANEPVDDGKEQEFQDEVATADSDRESDALSEIDENEFEDYDPETANIEDRPVDIDEDIARTLKASKRKRVAGDTPKKPREGRREKKRRDQDDDVGMEDGSEADGKAPRRTRRGGEGERRRAKPSSPEPDNAEELSPEERRKRAIDRALDAAIKKGGTTKRRRKDEIVRKLALTHTSSSAFTNRRMSGPGR
jgi:transcription factor SPN1